MRYNVVNMFDDVGKMRNDAGRLSNNVEEMAQLHGRIAGRMRNIFGEIQPALREGQKNAPEKGALALWFHSRGNGDVQISQTRCLEFEHNTQGIIGAERLGY